MSKKRAKSRPKIDLTWNKNSQKIDLRFKK